MSSHNNSQDHLDPITGAPGSHPTGTGIGAASGGIAGAAAGIPAGPIGMAVGATVGAIAGGLAGKAAAEAVSPTGTIEPDDAVAPIVDADAEHAYWRGQFQSEPYYVSPYTYDDYAPAFLTGYLGYSRLAGSRYEDIESDLERDYSANRAGSGLSWLEAKPATRSAWFRVHAAQPDTKG
jgi:hypothetical protein